MALKKYHKSANLFSGDFSQFDNTGGTGTAYAYFKLDGDFTIQAKAKSAVTVPANTNLGITANGGNADGGFSWIVAPNVTWAKGETRQARSSLNGQYVSLFSKYASTLEWITEHFDIMLVSGDYTAQTFPEYEPYDPEVWHTIPYKKYGTETDTITSLPKTIIGDGQPISSYTIKGNMTQSGTPTPSNPIYPTEVGDKTANLLDYKTVYAAYLQPNGDVTAPASYFNNTVHNSLADFIGKSITISVNCVEINSTRVQFRAVINGSSISGENKYQGYVGIMSFTVTPQTVNDWWSISYGTSGTDTYNQFMVSESSSYVPYEPYGYYKIPILSNGTTYPVYLAEPLRAIGDYADTVNSDGTVTRWVKKLVFTGDDGIIWAHSQTRLYSWFINPQQVIINGKQYTPIICTHGETVTSVSEYAYGKVYADNTYNIGIFPDTITSTTDLAQWLADQYANGTPVTVWYVLATATTESFTAPTIPTSGSPQTFDVDTTLKPSEVSLTYHGWHEHSDTKFTTP